MPEETTEVQVQPKQDKFQRLMTIVAYLLFLTALSYSPLSEDLIKMFAHYGLIASGGYGVLKTLQNLKEGK